MIRFLLASIVLLAMFAVADAQHRQRIVVQQNSCHGYDYVPPAIVVDKIVTVAQFVPIPVYSFGYADAGADALKAQVKDLSRELEFERLRFEIAELRSKVSSQPLSPVPQPQFQQKAAPSPPAPLPEGIGEHPGLIVLRNSCVKCHDATIAKAKGNNVTLFAGGQFVATDCDVLLLATHDIFDGSMPIGGKLTDEQKKQAIAFIKIVAAQKREAK